MRFSIKKKLFLNISQYPQETPLLESLFKKVASLKVPRDKRNPNTDIFLEYCKIFKAIYFEKHL